MSQEFPEAESPAGFAALEGSARFQGLRTPGVQRNPLPVRFMGPAKTTIVVESPAGTLERSNLQVSPRLPPAVSSQRGSLPSRSQRLRRREGRRREVAPVDARCSGMH